MRDLLTRAFVRSNLDRLIWKLRRGTLTIVTYHGVCGDEQGMEPWMPSCFVTESDFDEQMDYLGRNSCVLPLGEAVVRLGEGSLPDRAVSITFDDGYANNLYRALPILKKRAMSATLFVATSYVETGGFFPFDRLRLIKRITGHRVPLVDHKRRPFDEVVARLQPTWEKVQTQVSPQQRETLRPLSLHELQSIDPEVIELGSHTDSHCILGNETAERRQHEIQSSIEKLRAWTKRPVSLFCYPNGQPGDMNAEDGRVLKELGIVAAATTIPGVNHQDSNPLMLKRFPVGLFHNRAAFAYEVCGIRTAVNRMLRAVR